MSSNSPGSLAESPYAAQLAQGFRALRFASRALEREFQLEFSQQHQSRMRIGFAAAIALLALFLLLGWRGEPGPAREWGLLLRGTVVAALAVALVASWVRPLRFWFDEIVIAAYGAFAVGATALEVVAHRYGIERHYEGLILASFHVYVFGGLRLRPALVAGGLVFFSYLVGGAIGGLASREWGWQLLFIGLTHLVGGGALYSSELLERENFLRRRLFGVLASHDSLTGLFNRMAFFHELDRQLRQAARDGVPVGVMLLDVDHFKAFNDRYGHPEGDACLRTVAQAMREEFRRPLDIVGRYGGEEFIGLWYDVPPQSVRSLAEQVRAAVQALRIAHGDAPSGRVTASVGVVACLPREGESVLELVKRADTALYEAKQRGRNRVVAEILPSAQQAANAGRRAPSISAG